MLICTFLLIWFKAYIKKYFVLSHTTLLRLITVEWKSHIPLTVLNIFEFVV